MMVRPVLVSICLSVLVSCGGETPPTGPDVASLVLSRTAVKMLTGGTLEVDATSLDPNGQLLPAASVEYSSSNSGVATVSSMGIVTTLTPGTVFIRAQAGGASDSMRLEVTTARFGQVAAGGSHTCALTTTDGEAYCWGENFNGALGTGDTLSNPSPLAVRTSLRFFSLTLSQRTTCGIATDHMAYCWGSNGSGQLGLGTVDTEDHAEPAPVVAGFTFSALSAGISSTCGIVAQDVGYCWGSNMGGLLGNGLRDDAAAPTGVELGAVLTDIAVGQVHACALIDTGAAFCWGQGDDGRLGLGFDVGDLCGNSGGSSCIPTPAEVTGGHRFTELSATQTHTCAITTAGAAYCWGIGGYLGDGTTTTSNAPVPVSGVLTLHGLTTGDDATDGSNAHTCAIDAASKAYCWGANLLGQLGTGATSVVETSPVAVSGGLTWTSLSAGAAQTCGLATDRWVYCWGSAAGSFTPVPIPGQS